MRFLRRVVDGTTLLLGKLKCRQRKSIPAVYASSVKVNLGCGLAVAAGWINIDGSLNALIANYSSAFHRLAYRLTGASRYYSEQEYCRLLGNHFFIHHDLAYGIPLGDGSADFIYSSHFIEHLYPKDAQNLLQESYRVLRPGGTIRIAVPDLEFALSRYAAGEKEKMLTHYFFVDDDESHYARHKYMYDFAMLKQILEKTGFHEIRRCLFQEGIVPDLDILDNRVEDSLFVEATR